MRVPWWYGVALSTLVWIAFVLVAGAAPESSALEGPVADPLTTLAIVAWPAMPLCLYLDRRAHGDRMAWSPATRLWLVGSAVWFVNVGVGTAYCFRRTAAMTRTAPSRHWQTVAGTSVVLWAALLGLDRALPERAVSTATIDALTALVVVAWVAMPVALLLDAIRVRGYTDWDPPSRRYALGAAIPLVNLVVGLVYLYKRRDAFRGVDATRSYSPPPVAGEARGSGDDGAGPVRSPWFVRTWYVFGVYFLLLVLAGASLPSVSETGLEVLALVAWLPFGPVFAACVYKDVGWRRAEGVRVGGSWWLYLLSAVVQGVAFWYLLSRTRVATGHRQQRAEAAADG